MFRGYEYTLAYVNSGKLHDSVKYNYPINYKKC